MATRQVFFGGIRTTFSNTVSYSYAFPIGMSSSLTLHPITNDALLPQSGTFRDFRVELGTAPGAGEGTLFRLGKTGLGEISLRIEDFATVGVSTDSVHLEAGGGLAMRMTRWGGSGAASSTLHWSFVFVPDIDDKTILTCSTLGHAITTSDTYISPGSGLLTFIPSGVANRPVQALVIPAAGTIRDFYVSERSFAGPDNGDARTFVIQHTTTPSDTTFADSSITVTLQNGNTAGNDTSNTLPVSAGDRIVIKCTATGTPANEDYAFGLVFVPTISGDSIIAMCSGDDMHDITTEYNNILLGPSGSEWSTTETQKDIMGLREVTNSTVRITNMQGYKRGGLGIPGSGWRFILRKNAAATDMVVFVDDNPGPFSKSLSPGLLVNDGDLFATETDPSDLTKVNPRPDPRPVNISYTLSVVDVPTVHILGNTTILGKTTIR